MTLSGEHRRLACWFRRLAETIFNLKVHAAAGRCFPERGSAFDSRYARAKSSVIKVRFDETAKPALGTSALPGIRGRSPRQEFSRAKRARPDNSKTIAR
jgi:hypothetical protein